VNTTSARVEVVEKVIPQIVEQVIYREREVKVLDSEKAEQIREEIS
jgi:hypothetical protein